MGAWVHAFGVRTAFLEHSMETPAKLSPFWIPRTSLADVLRDVFIHAAVSFDCLPHLYRAGDSQASVAEGGFNRRFYDASGDFSDLLHPRPLGGVRK